MKKLLITLGLGLIIGIACQTEKKQEEPGTTTADSSSTSQRTDNDHPCSSTIVINSIHNELVSFSTAYRYYENYKNDVMTDKKNKKTISFCPGIDPPPPFIFLKCGRFLKDSLYEHLCLDEKSLIKAFYPTSTRLDTVAYDALRLYPCKKAKGSSNKIHFLFVLVKKFTTDSGYVYDDRKDAPVILIKLASLQDHLQDRLCKIGVGPEPHLMGKLTNHRLCVPNCPGDDDLLFDY